LHALGFVLFVCAILLAGVAANEVDSVGWYCASGITVGALAIFGFHLMGLV